MRLEIRWKWLESRQANRLHWKGSFYQCTVAWLIFIHVKYIHIFVQSIPYKILCMKTFIKTCFQSQYIPLPWGLFSIFCHEFLKQFCLRNLWLKAWFLRFHTDVVSRAVLKGTNWQRRFSWGAVYFAQNLFRNYLFLAIATPPRCL